MQVSHQNTYNLNQQPTSHGDLENIFVFITWSYIGYIREEDTQIYFFNEITYILRKKMIDK